MAVNFSNRPPYDDGSRVSWNYHADLVPPYYQSATDSLVDYQSDQSFRYLYSKIAVENTLPNSCPYETPFDTSTRPYQDPMVQYPHDENVETRPGSLLSAQAVMGTSSQPDYQATVSDTLVTDTRDNISQPPQPPQLPQPPQSQLFEAESAKPLASPTTGSGYDFMQSVTGVFYNTEKFGNRDLPEISFTIRRRSMEAEVKFAVGTPISALSGDWQRSKDPGQTLTKALTFLVDGALKVTGEHKFHIHSDESSTKIRKSHQRDATQVTREVGG
jgi:hypothetical protein